MQRERSVLALGDLALDVRDLVLGLLRVELDDAGLAAFGIGLAARDFDAFLALVLALGGFGALGGWVDVGVWVQGGRRRRG